MVPSRAAGSGINRYTEMGGHSVGRRHITDASKTHFHPRSQEKYSECTFVLCVHVHTQPGKSRHTHAHTHRGRGRDRHTDRQTDRHTFSIFFPSNTHTHTHTHALTHTHTEMGHKVIDLKPISNKF